MSDLTPITSTFLRNDELTRLLSGKVSTGKVSLDGNATYTDGSIDGKYGGEMNDGRTYNKRSELRSRSLTDKAHPSGGTITLAYDANGNLTDDGELYTYKFNPFGQLVEISDRSGTPVLQARYTYNGLGQRISEQTDTNNSASITKNGTTYSANAGVTDGKVDSSDPVFFIAVDEQGRRVATFRDTDTYPKEYFIYNLAGGSGRGGASGPAFASGGGVVLRARNASLSDPTKWALETATSTHGERRYYCADFRGNVSALVKSDGKLAEQYRYSATGVPFGIPLGDITCDGVTDSSNPSSPPPHTDHTLLEKIRNQIPFVYADRADLDLDGDVDASDTAALDANDTTTIGTTGRGVLSTSPVANRVTTASSQLILLMGLLASTNGSDVMDLQTDVRLSSQIGLRTGDSLSSAIMASTFVRPYPTYPNQAICTNWFRQYFGNLTILNGCATAGIDAGVGCCEKGGTQNACIQAAMTAVAQCQTQVSKDACRARCMEIATDNCTRPCFMCHSYGLACGLLCANYPPVNPTGISQADCVLACLATAPAGILIGCSACAGCMSEASFGCWATCR